MGDIRKTTNSDTPTRLQPFTPLERGSIETDQQPKKDKLEETVKEVFKAQTTIREKTDLNEGKSVWKHIKSLFSSLLRRTYLIAHQKFSFAMASSRDDVKITYGIVRQEMLIDHITQLIGRIEVNTIKDVERLIWLDKQLDKCQANLELQREFYQKKSNLSSSQLKLIYTFDLFNEKIRLARDAFAEKVNLSTSNIRELILTKNQAIKPVTLVEISELLIRLGQTA